MLPRSSAQHKSTKDQQRGVAMIAQILAIFGLIFIAISIDKENWTKYEKAEDYGVSISKVLHDDDCNAEPRSGTKHFSYFDFQALGTGEPQVFKKVSIGDLEKMIGQYGRNEPHSFVLITPDGDIEIKHVLFEHVKIWNFPFARLLFNNTLSKQINVKTTYIRDYPNLENLSENELVMSDKLLWINALYFFTGESFFSNHLLEGAKGEITHSTLHLKGIEKHKLGCLALLMRNVLLKTIQFDKKTGQHCLSKVTNALPLALKEYLKELFPTKRAIRKLTRKKALELYSWICENAAKAFEMA